MGSFSLKHAAIGSTCEPLSQSKNVKTQKRKKYDINQQE